MVWLMFVEFQEVLNHVSLMCDPLCFSEIIFNLRNLLTEGKLVWKNYKLTFNLEKIFETSHLIMVRGILKYFRYNIL